MLNLPASAAFERRIPKQKFYANLTVTPELRRCFTEQIESITWADKLAPQTMNLAAGQWVQEIEVFRIRLAGDTLDGKVTELMDKQIPYHILFVLTRPDGMLRLLMNYGAPPRRLFYQSVPVQPAYLPTHGLPCNGCR